MDNILTIRQPTGKELAEMFLDRFLTDEIAINVVNIIFSAILAVYMLFFKVNAILWWIFLVAIIILHICYTISSCRSCKKRNAVTKNQTLINKFYEETKNINQKIASGIYDLYGFIDDLEKDNNPINTHIFDNRIDIYTVSSYVCESIQKAITEVYDKEIECQVTIFKLDIDKNEIKMIAYSNNENKKPDTFINTYKVNANSRKFHVKIFRKNSSSPFCLCNQDEVSNNFDFNTQSIEREEKICQYIGLPLKTDRGKIELLLQIDVSKDGIFGDSEDELKNFAKEFLYPFIVYVKNTRDFSHGMN